jgi:hypothetical protein
MEHIKGVPNMASINERLKKIAVSAAEAAVSMTRSDYFDSSERGELKELRDELLSDTYIIRREAVRKVIAGMTLGVEEYGQLFPEILRCLQSKDLETKRLVYLYMGNYSQQNPDMALLAMNTVVKDSNDKSPVVRSLALRTMSSLRIPNLVEYLDDPLRRALQDEHAMVRRTAAICIGKIYKGNREYFDEMELAVALRGLIMEDKDPFVVCNAVAVLLECDLVEECDLLRVDPEMIARLSVILEKADEWGQVQIINTFTAFLPQATMEQATVLLKRADALLAHSNPALVMAVSRMILNYVHHRFPEFTALYDRRIASSLTAMLSSPPETTPMTSKFVLLEVLEGVVRLVPSITPPLPVVYVNHEDQLFVKEAKLRLLTAMADRQTLPSLLVELAEYARRNDNDDDDEQYTMMVMECFERLAARFRSLDGRLYRMILMAIVELLLQAVGSSSEDGSSSKTGSPILFQSAIVSLYNAISDGHDDLVLAVLGAYLQHPHLVSEGDSRAALVFLASQVHTDTRLPVAVLSMFSIEEEPLLVQFALIESGYRLCATDDQFKQTVLSWMEWAEGADSVDLCERARLLHRLLTDGVRVVLEHIEGGEHVGEYSQVWTVAEMGRVSTVYHRQIAHSTDTCTGSDDGAIADGVTDYLTHYPL